VKDEIGNLLADSHNILNRWKNYFSQLLNEHNVSDVRQIEVHTAESLVPDPSRLEVEIAIAKLKKYKSPSSYQFQTELIKQGLKHYCPQSTNSLILFGIRENCLISGRSPLFYQFRKRVIELTVITIMGYHCYHFHTKCFVISLSQGYIYYMDEIIGEHQCEFRHNRSTTDQIFCIHQILEKKWEYNETIYELFIDLKKAYD
jgi:hypothetical protein